MAANHSNDDEIEILPFGSWTVFKSMVNDNCTIQSDLDSLVVIIPCQPNHCEKYRTFAERHSFSIGSGTAKHLFRNDLIKLSCDSIEKNSPKNAVHVYDGMAIVRSDASQKICGDLWRLLLKGYTPNMVHSPSRVHIVFDNYYLLLTIKRFPLSKLKE